MLNSTSICYFFQNMLWNTNKVRTGLFLKEICPIVLQQMLCSDKQVFVNALNYTNTQHVENVEKFVFRVQIMFCNNSMSKSSLICQNFAALRWTPWSYEVVDISEWLLQFHSYFFWFSKWVTEEEKCLLIFLRIPNW